MNNRARGPVAPYRSIEPVVSPRISITSWALNCSRSIAVDLCATVFYRKRINGRPLHWYRLVFEGFLALSQSAYRVPKLGAHQEQ